MGVHVRFMDFSWEYIELFAANMKLNRIPLWGPLIAVAATAFECTPSAFQAILPANATVTFARSLSANSTFVVPLGDIAYPKSPTQLQALCAVQIKVPSSPTSAFSLGLFLPQDWNERFLAVGNGGFAGTYR